jgi:hypothetical protein
MYLLQRDMLCTLWTLTVPEDGDMKENQRQFKMNVPDDIMGWVENEAGKNCRSKSAQIIFALRSVMAAGGEFGDKAPAAGSEAAAR